MSIVDTITHAYTGHYQAHGNIDQADCVIGFSFGYRGRGKSATPGLSNQDLAHVAMQHFGDLPKILQFEIADAYCQAGGKHCRNIERIQKHRQANKYLDTYEVAYQAKVRMDVHGWKTAVVLAHPFHAPRAEAVCQKLGINTVVTDHLRGAVEFDPLSTQKWTRSLDQWRGYEPLAICFYKLKGYL